MRTTRKWLIATLFAMAALVFVLPAYAFAGAGAGMGAAQSGPPQDCVATVSCNIPVTQMVPYQAAATAMQTVQYPVNVPVQTTVTVPKTVVVPQQVPVTVSKTVCAQKQVPVQVPVTAYQPVTTKVPQVFTIPLGGQACGSGGMGAGAYGAQGNIAPVGQQGSFAGPAGAPSGTGKMMQPAGIQRDRTAGTIQPSGVTPAQAGTGTGTGTGAGQIADGDQAVQAADEDQVSYEHYATTGDRSPGVYEYLGYAGGPKNGAGEYIKATGTEMARVNQSTG